MNFRKKLLFLCSSLILATPLLKAESPGMAEVGSAVIYSDLKVGDSREVVLEKLRKASFIQIYEERDRELVKCSVRWNGFRYELTCKLENNKLKLCLIEGQKGWQFSFYEEILHPQWTNLRERLVQKYGANRELRNFPKLKDVPMGDPGGYVTDTWELKDRLLMLTVQSFKVKDCCTNKMVEYSSCTLLIQPK
jgi:hypothetical protein|tara:strand:+ start:497 stop:1075 length:579 start_codon:yes stop_codon:yes gene_type:complete